MLEDFLRAFLIGFVIAAAVGPVGILCIRRAINTGFWGGFTSGLGAAVADGVYGAVAAFGLVAVDSLSGGVGDVGRMVGGVILIYLGISVYRSKIDMKSTPVDLKGHVKGFGGVFLLTLSNPLTIISFLAIFAGLGVTIGSAPIDKILLILGVFLGSAFWWLILAWFASSLRHKLDQRKIRFINIASSIIITGFGLFSLLNIAYS